MGRLRGTLYHLFLSHRLLRLTHVLHGRLLPPLVASLAGYVGVTPVFLTANVTNVAILLRIITTAAVTAILIFHHGLQADLVKVNPKCVQFVVNMPTFHTRGVENAG